MVSSILRRASFAALIGIALPALAAAQQAPTSAPAGEQPPLTAQEQEMQGWYDELQQLHTQLQTIQEQALADQTLAARQEALGEEIRLAMAARDATVQQQIDRMSSLETEAISAQQTNNIQRLQELMTEATGIQEHLMNLQQQVIEEPSMAAKLDLFQTDLQKKMAELNPNAQQMMERFQELEAKLTAAMMAE